MWNHIIVHKQMIIDNWKIAIKKYNETLKKLLQLP